MATYILLMKMTQKGRRKMLADPESMLASAQGIDVPDTGVLGLYAVLGEYDFVGIVSAPGNEEVAQFSMNLGVRAGVHITTLPAIPIGRLGEGGAPLAQSAVAPEEEEIKTEIVADGRLASPGERP